MIIIEVVAVVCKIYVNLLASFCHCSRVFFRFVLFGFGVFCLFGGFLEGGGVFEGGDFYSRLTVTSKPDLLNL